MADLGTEPARGAGAAALPPGRPPAAAPAIQEDPAAEAEEQQSGADEQSGAAVPAALQDAQSGPTPPTPPTAGKRSGDVPAEEVDGAVAGTMTAAALVAVRLPPDLVPPAMKSSAAADGLPLQEQSVRPLLWIPCVLSLPHFKDTSGFTDSCDTSGPGVAGLESRSSRVVPLKGTPVGLVRTLWLFHCSLQEHPRVSLAV